MRIRTMNIIRLFGLFDYHLEFNVSERITIIHGPNGTGKTTILRILNLIFGERLAEVARIPFKAISVVFDDGSELSLGREMGDTSQRRFWDIMGKRSASARERIAQKYPEGEDSEPVLTVRLDSPGQKTKEGKLGGGVAGRGARPLSPSMIERLVPWLERVDEDMWIDTRDGEGYDYGEVVARFGAGLPVNIPQEISDFLSGIRVHFIQTQRLLVNPEYGRHGRTREGYRSAVAEYGKEMVERIQEELAASFQEYQKLAAQFPNRVLRQGPLSVAVTDQVIREMYEAQLAKSQRLVKAGLLAPGYPVSLSPGELDEMKRRVLWCYLQDQEQILGLCDSLLERIELMQNMVNGRFLHKNFAISREEGFVFTTPSGTQLPLSALSSGEQHEVILAFELLFRAQKGTMILIDEPELSLHVSWQHKFLDDLSNISKLVGLDFIVATHSPQIINEHWDLTIALAEDE